MQTRHILSLVLAMPLVSLAQTQTPVFTDYFTSGNDTLNQTSVVGGTAANSWTSWDIASTKAATTGPTLSSGALRLSLNSTTGSGVVEGQALFTSSAITLANSGDYIQMQVVFTQSTALAGGTSSYLYAGLYNSGGAAPAIGLNNSGLNTTAGSAYATGNAAGWKGYVARISNGGNSQFYTRPAQTGTGTTSANQDLVGNNAGGGLYNNPTGTTLGSSQTSAVGLTSGNQYTLDLKIIYDGSGTLTLTDTLFSGAGTGGTSIFTETRTATGANLLTTTFDGLAIGLRNSGTSYNPTIDINQVSIVFGTPEPSAAALLAGGSVLAILFRRRLQA